MIENLIPSRLCVGGIWELSKYEEAFKYSRCHGKRMCPNSGGF